MITIILLTYYACATALAEIVVNSAMLPVLLPVGKFLSQNETRMNLLERELSPELSVNPPVVYRHREYETLARQTRHSPGEVLWGKKDRDDRRKS